MALPDNNKPDDSSGNNKEEATMSSTRQVFTEEYFDTCREVTDFGEIEHYIADNPKCTGLVIETDTTWSYEERTIPNLRTLEYLPKLQIIPLYGCRYIPK